MDALNVLSHFLRYSRENGEYLQHSLASNAVLDWFGRTVRGPKNIEQFLRQDIWRQYEQNFSVANACDPIETKTTHEQTKTPPEENTLPAMAPVPSLSCLDSPPRARHIPSQHPPPLTRNRKFLTRRPPVNSDSDSDLDVQQEIPPQPIENNNEIGTKSYNLRSLANETNATKCAQKPVIQSHCKLRGLRKRPGDKVTVSIIEPVPVPIKRNKNLRSNGTESRRATTAAVQNGADENEHATATSANNNYCKQTYTDLMYLESIGSIRTIQRAKHPYINRVPTARNHITPLVSPESQNNWNRKTRLKISYRQHILNRDDIQFALILYEPLAHGSRRNLLLEFQMVAEEEAAEEARLQDEDGGDDEVKDDEGEEEEKEEEERVEEEKEKQRREHEHKLHQSQQQQQKQTKESALKQSGAPLRASSNVTDSVKASKKATPLTKAKAEKMSSLRRLRF